MTPQDSISPPGEEACMTAAYPAWAAAVGVAGCGRCATAV